MSQVCQVTGKRPIRAMNVSHSHIRTLRRQVPNLHHKRYWVPSENRFVTLRLSCHGMKIVDKRGIELVLTQLRARGEKI
jgi:large subunit ribosomal protein L28